MSVSPPPTTSAVVTPTATSSLRPPQLCVELADSSINLLNKQQRADLLVRRELTASFVFIVLIPNYTPRVGQAQPNVS